MVGILKGVHAEQSTENNTKAFSVLIAFSGAVWREFPNYVTPVIISYTLLSRVRFALVLL